MDKEDVLRDISQTIATWSEINKYVPENVKYHDLIEDLKKNSDIKGLPEYIPDHILPVLEKKEDQTITKVTGLLYLRYGRSRTEKV